MPHITENDTLYIGQAGEHPQHLLLRYANRHGLIAGATGTGKTLSLQGLAEGFSASGVPVFIADIKGDLSGLAQAGIPKPPLEKRANDIGFTLNYTAFPTIFWDVFGNSGHPLRTTISELGPLLLASLLQLNEVQEGVLNVAFEVADKEGLLLLNLEDLGTLLTHLADNSAHYAVQYGAVSSASVAAIKRALLSLQSQGAAHFFGEPAINITQFIAQNPQGYGNINILSADQLIHSPALYVTFMLWLMSELFETLPEIGDLAKPKLVFFFDEAHLLFANANKELTTRIVQLVKLIRSKGVGIYFITQSPSDIPKEVLAQLSNRIQHALRAFTPKDQKSVKAAATTFRQNPAFDTASAITELAIGEALVSTLNDQGIPCMVERTLIRPPVSYVGAITAAQRQDIMQHSVYAGLYDTEINRHSAHEMLAARLQKTETAPSSSPAPRPPSTMQHEATKVARSVLISIGSTIGREIARGIMRSIMKR
jgi:DNA helicase HerA-like ATPase